MHNHLLMLFAVGYQQFALSNDGSSVLFLAQPARVNTIYIWSQLQVVSQICSALAPTMVPFSPNFSCLPTDRRVVFLGKE